MSDKIRDIIDKQTKAQDKGLSQSEDIIQLVGFVIGEEEYAVPILTIQEIIKPISWTRVPQTPQYVLGVFNLRGSVIPIIDLRLKFGSPAKINTDETRVFVLKQDDEVAGFVIDRLTEAIRIKKTNIGPPPDTIASDDTMIDGVGKQEGRIITILKVDKLLARDF